MIVAQRFTKTFGIFAFVSMSVSADCFEKYGAMYDVSAPLLRAICFTESGNNPNAVNANNSDGTIDYGLCQVNSWWLPRLEKYGITKEVLLKEPCKNIEVSAWILAQNYETSGEGWLAVGAYNAGYKNTPEKERARQVYIAKIQENLERMQ